MFHRRKTSEIKGFCGKSKVEALSSPRSRFWGPVGKRGHPEADYLLRATSRRETPAARLLDDPELCRLDKRR